MSDSSNRNRLDRAIRLAAVLLAIPPALALTAAAFPAYVPMPFVDVSEPERMRPVLVAIGLGLLIVNVGFLVLVRQWASRNRE